MAGGTFNEAVGKTRAGLYINFKAAALARIQSGSRGTVTIPLVLNWGNPKTFLSIEEEADAFDKLGYDINEDEMLMIRETKKKAKTALVYRLNVGVKAQVSWGVNPVTAIAKFGGTRGNDIKVIAETNVLDNAKMDVKTLVDNREQNVQTVATIEDLVANEWIGDWQGVGAIEATVGTNLTGGTNGVVINQDHTDFLSATETQKFDVIAYPVNDPTLQSSFVTFIKRMRDDEGKKIQGVVPGYAGDHEGIINVKNGVELEDDTKLDNVQTVAWVAGASAGASVSESNTYATYEGATDANPRLKHGEIVEALKKGEFVFIHDGESVKVEQDINSLVTFGQDKNKRFTKNRVIRVLDAINNDLMREFNKSFVGKVDNEEDGQSLLKDAVIQYFYDLQDAKALKNVNPDEDFVINSEKSIGEEVWADVGAQPVDSMEKFFFAVRVR